jgi:hypothetical protein
MCAHRFKLTLTECSSVKTCDYFAGNKATFVKAVR